MSVGVTQLALRFKNQPVEGGSASTPLVRRRLLGAPGMHKLPDPGLSALIPSGQKFAIQLARIVASFFPSLPQIGKMVWGKWDFMG